MNKGLRTARKNYLWCLIKKVSNVYGGDDMEVLKHHCKEGIDVYPEEKIAQAITCYFEMSKLMNYYSERQKNES